MGYWGYNLVNSDKKKGSTHAEKATFEKYRKKKNKKRMIKATLLVIQAREYTNGEEKKIMLRKSKPCIDCERNIKIFINTTKVYISEIYYSNETGIVKKKLLDLFDDENKHLSIFRRNRFK